MVGIYKITNKLNGKIYVGQSKKCGGRLDQHYDGHSNQFIDMTIQIEGEENFTFELLKEVAKEELDYWEDYYIIYYDCYFPSGYNRRWNNDETIRASIKVKVEADKAKALRQEEAEKEITINDILYLFNDKLFYIYCLNYLMSSYNKQENKYLILKKNATAKHLNNYIDNIKYNTITKYQSILKEKHFLAPVDINDKAAPYLEFNYIPDIFKYLSNEEILIAKEDCMMLWYIKKHMAEFSQIYFFGIDFIWMYKVNSAGCYHSGTTIAKIRERIKRLQDKGLIQIADLESNAYKIKILP